MHILLRKINGLVREDDDWRMKYQGELNELIEGHVKVQRKSDLDLWRESGRPDAQKKTSKSVLLKKKKKE